MQKRKRTTILAMVCIAIVVAVLGFALQDQTETSYYPDGKLKSVLRYKAKLLHGLVEFYYPSGRQKEISEYIAGNKSGLSQTFYESGRIKEQTEYSGGTPEGLFKSYHENGKLKSEGHRENGEYEGRVRTWYENGKLEQDVMYKAGKLHGPYKEFYINGATKISSNYIDGTLDGKYLEFYEDGTAKMEAVLSFGQSRSSKETKREISETQKIETQYENGMKHGYSKIYDRKTGQLVREETYFRDKIHGPVTEYMADQLTKRCSFVQSKMHGKCETWSVDGVLTSEREYEYGVPRGIHKVYNDRGTLISTEDFTREFQNTLFFRDDGSKKASIYETPEKCRFKLYFDRQGELCFYAVQSTDTSAAKKDSVCYSRETFKAYYPLPLNFRNPFERSENCG